MTIKSKQKLVELIASLAWFGGYLLYAFSGNAPEVDNLRGWATALLIAVVISVGVLLIASAGFNNIELKLASRTHLRKMKPIRPSLLKQIA